VAIPVPEIAIRAAETQALLRGYEPLQSAGPTVSMVEKELPEAGTLVGEEARETIGLLREQPTLETLEAQQEIWGNRKVLATTWLSALTQRATRIHGALTNLAELQQTWTVTQDAALAAQAPTPTLAQIANVLAEIETVRKSLQPQLAATLELQGRAAELSARCESMLAEIDRAQRRTMGGLLRRDAPPIWTADFWRRVGMAGVHRVRDAAIAWWEEFGKYASNPANGLKVHVVAFLVLAVLERARRSPPRCSTGRSPPRCF
jgi:small-conductance mechanosensitive channel